jgi:transporter family-2 protein
MSALAGVTIVLSRIINSKLAEKLGTLQGTLINYITGLTLSFLCYLFSNEIPLLTFHVYKSIPLWAYLGGLTGVIVILSSNYITPRISTFYITLLIFIGQLIIGIFIDYFMLHELSIGKVIGGLFVIIGLTYNLLIDKNTPVVSE